MAAAIIESAAIGSRSIHPPTGGMGPRGIVPTPALRTTGGTIARAGEGRGGGGADMLSIHARERPWSGYIIRVQQAADGWRYTLRANDAVRAGESWLASGGGFGSEREAFEDAVRAVIELERRRSAVQSPA
jgi:hypothetical protein